MSAPPEPLPAIASPQAGPVPLPPPPGNPPTIQDVIEAENYVERIRNRAVMVQHPTVDPGVRADARRYEWQILSRFSGDAASPPALSALIGRVDTLERRTEIRLTVIENLNRGDGTAEPFEEVMNRNGDLPTMPPNNFVLLSSAAVINNLTNPRTNNYFRFYFPDANLTGVSLTRKRNAIKKAVGCRLSY